MKIIEIYTVQTTRRAHQEKSENRFFATLCASRLYCIRAGVFPLFSELYTLTAQAVQIKPVCVIRVPILYNYRYFAPALLLRRS